ncbi:flavin reductase family protein [Filimonas effusa]|uniref:Iron-sulfur cluster-binding domain-containing protein n=1 Tax=Filimonas effusa TaxID=2508721 RepID=A0A4Q1D844_9BACT|nr:iron-sulfur cluster-binding domain-containing protein [Filimonas effusa]RXK85360.1 iron-sulfur cluster-binding domain-containing protein [Filimonas effusa]
MEQDAFFKQVRITHIKWETKDAASFELEPLDGWQPVYEAGQFITLVFTHHGKEERRSYSFSSAPALNEPMRITIKRVANGAYSRYLLDHAREGDILVSSGIGGFFHLPHPPQATEVRQLFFLAAGSGITPVYALIKTALHTTTLPIILVYSNRSAGDTIFLEQLQQLQQQHPGRFYVEYLYSNTLNVYTSRLSNWLLLHLLKKHSKFPGEQCLFYTCGPFEYMRTIAITLLTEGVPAANIRKEDFSSFKPAGKPVPPDTQPHQVTIHMGRATYQFSVRYPNNILAAAKALGINLPYSCEAGRCGSCTATCEQGSIWMACNEVLMDDEIAKGRVLTCQGYPIGGDATLRF